MNKHKFTLLSAWLAAITYIICVFQPIRAYAYGAKDLNSYFANLPFQMQPVKEPVFPDRQISIAERGAVPDGKTLNTKAFADAIHACAEAGGGTVLVPSGLWLTGPIKLESNVNLLVERGALVQFSSRYEDFPLVAGLGGNSKKFEVAPPISGYRLTNIAITGEGIFDGSGESWRPQKKEKQTASQWKKLIGSGGVISEDGKMWWPSKQAMEGESYLKNIAKSKGEFTEEDAANVREFLRPDLLKLIQCKGVLLDGPTFRNSPKYHLHPVQSEDIIIRNTTVSTPWFAQNGDGIDLSACRNVIVYRTTVDAGDDGICMKPGKIASSQKPGPSCENIVIADCTVYHGHGGFVIGSESNGGAHNISVKNCTFIGTDIGLRFKSNRGRGGLVDNIFIDGIQMKAISEEAISFDMYYAGNGPGEVEKKSGDLKTEEPVNETTPQFENISIKNIVCNGASEAIFFDGLPEMPIRNISIENARIMAEKGIECIDADSIAFNNVEIVSKTGPVVILNQARNIYLSGIKYPTAAEQFLIVNGEKAGNIQLKGIDLSGVKKDVEIGKNVKQDAVIKK